MHLWIQCIYVYLCVYVYISTCIHVYTYICMHFDLSLLHRYMSYPNAYICRPYSLWLFIHNFMIIRLLVKRKTFCCPMLFLPWVASTQAVRNDLSRSLLTCILILYRVIWYLSYIDILVYTWWIAILYIFMLNKFCLSLSLSQCISYIPASLVTDSNHRCHIKTSTPSHCNGNRNDQLTVSHLLIKKKQ